MAQRNAHEPADRRIELRIGIHVGDVIIDEGDIFGDGVNIAARLEGIAEAGGICTRPTRSPRSSMRARRWRPARTTRRRSPPRAS
jgi:class 3 adenylate cyclase